MEDKALQLIQEYEECAMIEEECQLVINKHDIYSTERMDNSLQMLEEKTTSLRTAIAYFRTNPHTRVTAEKGQSMIELRMKMLLMIETLSEHRTTRLKTLTAPTQPGISSTGVTAPVIQLPAQTNRLNSTTLVLRQSRVKLKRDPLLVEMDDLSNKFIDLKDNEIKQLGQFNKLSGKFKELLDKGQRTLQKAKSLCEDAMSTDMQEDALAIDTQSTALEFEMSGAESFIDSLRAKFGVPVTGYSNNHQSTNIPIPYFTGAKTDKHDLFTFKKKFQIYIDSMPSIADVEALEILKETCLQGNAQLLCSAEKSIENCMKQLSFHYGSKTSILAKRKAKIMELGPCPSKNWEQQIAWMVKLRSLLADTQEFARENDAENTLYHGKTDIANSVLNLFKGEYFKEMSKIFLRSADANGEEDGKYCYEQLLKFLDSELRILQYQLNQRESASYHPNSSSSVNIEKITSNSSGDHQQYKKHTSDGSSASLTYSISEEAKLKKQFPAKIPTPTLVYTGSAEEPKMTDCELCQSRHTHLYQCQIYLATPHKEKRKLHGQTKSCHRCLRMDANIDFDNLDGWWNHHKNDCRTDFYCQTDSCLYASAHRMQKHILACSIHVEQNKKHLDEFCSSLPEDVHLPTGNLLFMDNITMNLQTSDTTSEVTEPKTLPDVVAPGIFMCQNIPDKHGKPLLIFYDSGCGTAAISASAAARLNAIEKCPGPSLMNVAGGKVVHLPYGSDKFQLPLVDNTISATVTAAKMDTLTASFPKWDLTEPYTDLVNHYKGHEILPTVPDVIGGSQADIILGIKYNYLFPTHICTLPCGLSLYRSPIKGINGHTGVLGGPHKAWARASETINFVGAAIFFTNELSTYHYNTEALSGSGRNWYVEASKPDTFQHDNLSPSVDRESKKVNANSIDVLHAKTCKQEVHILKVNYPQKGANQPLIKQSITFKHNIQPIVETLPCFADPVKEVIFTKNRTNKFQMTQLTELSSETKLQVLVSDDKQSPNGSSCDIDELPPDVEVRAKCSQQAIPSQEQTAKTLASTGSHEVLEENQQTDLFATDIDSVFINNGCTPTGPAIVDKQYHVFEQMEHMYQSQCQNWPYNMLDFIATHKQYKKTGSHPNNEDIVMNLHAPDELIGDQLWHPGQVAHLIMSEDCVACQVIIRWREHWKEEFQDTVEATGTLLFFLFKDELSLVDHIRSASAQTSAAFIME